MGMNWQKEEAKGNFIVGVQLGSRSAGSAGQADLHTTGRHAGLRKACMSENAMAGAQRV